MTKSNRLAVKPDSAYALVMAATNDAERYAAGQFAVETVADPETGKPIPRFAYDLPWAADGADAADEILARIAGTSDLETATDDVKLRKARAIIEQPIEVLGLQVRASDVPDSKYGCYLALTCSVAGGAPEVINVGAPQVMVIMWRAWCEGKFPLRGYFAEVGTPKKGQDPALSFRIETELA